MMSQEDVSQAESVRRRTLDVRVTIDTDLMPDSRNPHDAGNPIEAPRHRGYMILTGNRRDARGAEEIALDAAAGDTVRFFISSGSNNFEQPVLLEAVRHVAGDEVLKPCEHRLVKRQAIAPESRDNILPCRLTERRFHFCQCVVAGGGTGHYELIFGIHGRGEDAQPREAVFYRWAMRLTVHSNRRES